MQTQPSLPVRLLKLIAATAALALIVYLAQIPIQKIPAFKAYSEAADKYDLHPGALYYSDVPVTLDAERHLRAAVKSVDDQHLRERREKRD